MEISRDAGRLTMEKCGVMVIVVIFLMVMYMVFMVLVFCVVVRMGYFEKKLVGRVEVVKFGVLNSASIALLNLSLGFNLVGFY